MEDEELLAEGTLVHRHSLLSKTVRWRHFGDKERNTNRRKERLQLRVWMLVMIRSL